MRWLLAPLESSASAAGEQGPRLQALRAPPVWTQGTLLWPTSDQPEGDHAGHAAGGGLPHALPMPFLPRAAQRSSGSDSGAQAGQGEDGVGGSLL